jgi:hypothetical protein
MTRYNHSSPFLIPQLMMGGKGGEPMKAKDIREKAVLARSQLLRSNYGFLTLAGFRQRLAYFTDKVRTRSVQ